MTITADTILTAQAGSTEAQEALLAQLKGYLVQEAKRYPGEMEDLLQAGRLGLLEALGAFDPSGARDVAAAFATYAKRWVTLRLNEVAQGTHLVTVPDRTQRRVIKAIQSGDSSADDVAPGTFVAASQAMAPTVPLGGETWMEALGDWTDRPKTRLPIRIQHSVTMPPDEDSRVDDVRELVGRLAAEEPLQARVIQLHYGLTGDEPLTDAQVATEVGVSRPTAQRLRAKAEARLRELAAVSTD